MEKLELDKKNLKNFGITMCIVFLVITSLIIIKHKHSIVPTAVISAVFLLLALIHPLLLNPIYIIWMKLAFVLGWFNTRLLLLIIFYLVFTPIGLVMRLLRIDLLERRIDKSTKSYWVNKDKKNFNPPDYERQF